MSNPVQNTRIQTKGIETVAFGGRDTDTDSVGQCLYIVEFGDGMFSSRVLECRRFHGVDRCPDAYCMDLLGTGYFR